MINIARVLMRLFGLLARVRAHTRAGGAVRVSTYWRRT